MPIYEYKCKKCDFKFEEYAEIKDHRADNTCPHCANVAPRTVSMFSAVMGTKKARIKDGFKPGFNPGLGMHVETEGQLKKECKKRGLQVVGNDNIKRSEKKESISREELKAIRRDIAPNVSDRELDMVKKAVES